MRIAVAGKGGSGKTTISATLSRILAREGYSVVAIDGDPNPNLARALGVSPEDFARLAPIPGDLVEEVADLQGHVHIALARPLLEIAERSGAACPDGVRLLMGSQVEGAGTGCLCGAHSTVQALIGGAGLGERQAIVLDMEASLEHMSRGTARHVETMLMVTEPYFRSLETTGRLANLGQELGIGRLAVVANKVRNTDEERAIRDYCERRGLEISVVIPYDPEVTRVDNAGGSLIDGANGSQAVGRIRELAGTLNGKGVA